MMDIFRLFPQISIYSALWSENVVSSSAIFQITDFFLCVCVF